MCGRAILGPDGDDNQALGSEILPGDGTNFFDRNLPNTFGIGGYIVVAEVEIFDLREQAG